jgi:subtilisin-like proprotein convertase family protein
VKDSITLVGDGKIKSIKVYVEILHTYEGDIKLNLISPQGTNVLLALNHRQPGNDLIESYDSTTHQELQRLVGEGLSGDWILHVQDLLPQDTGRVNAWTIDIEYEGANATVEVEDRPLLVIPDNDPQGIKRTLHIDENGICKDIKVSLDISHTFIRDLRVELLAPTGHSVFLHNREGGGADDVKRTYDRASLPNLDTLLQLPIQGDWLLHVKDLEGADEGNLNRWAIKLTYE